MRRRAALLLVAAGASIGLSACTSTTSPGPGPQPPDPQHSRLVARADLAPCPASSSTAVSGGLPNVTLMCLGNGPAVHLAGLVGTPTVVNVWASWCGPCRDEAVALSTVYDADKGKVRFLGVDTADDPDSALDFGAHVTPPVRYPSVVDPEKKVLLGLAKAPGPPETVFLDATGVIVHVHLGAYTNAAALRSDLATYLHVS